MDSFEIIRAKRNFTTISNRIFQDPALSLKAKGLLCTCLSLPASWRFSIRGLTKLCREGVEAIQSALRELEEQGYLRRETQDRGETGRFASARYIFFEDPEEAMEADTEGDGGAAYPETEEKPETADRDTGLPCAGNPYTAEPAQLNNKKSKTKEYSIPPIAPPSSAETPEETGEPEEAEGSEGREEPEEERQEGPEAQEAREEAAGRKRKAASRRGRPQKQGAGPVWKPERFEAFWAYYPRGEGKEQARRAWDKLRPDDATIDAMALALKRQKASRMWREGIGVPYASTWLNQRRWEDETREGVSEAGSAGGIRSAANGPAVVESGEVELW